jgi:hypothetical protein
MDDTADSWLDEELAGCDLADERLNKRLRKLLAQVGGAMGQSIPLVCQDCANTKAAYRFFSNDRVNEADILAGHFLSTRNRMANHDGLVLMLHDTTEFTYQRERTEAIGITKSVNSGSMPLKPPARDSRPLQTSMGFIEEGAQPTVRLQQHGMPPLR